MCRAMLKFLVADRAMKEKCGVGRMARRPGLPRPINVRNIYFFDWR